MLDIILKFYLENYNSFILGVGEKVFWNGFGLIYFLKIMCFEYEFKDVICFYWVVDLWDVYLKNIIDGRLFISYIVVRWLCLIIFN